MCVHGKDHSCSTVKSAILYKIRSSNISNTEKWQPCLQAAGVGQSSSGDLLSLDTCIGYNALVREAN